MNEFFYLKLASSNIRKNRRTYLPYILTCIGVIAMFYIMHFISVNEGIDQMVGSEPLKMILVMGTIVIGIFSVLFLLYTNSFLNKRRKKEIGLYNILRMEKRHIARMLLCETFIIFFISMLFGLISGIILSKLIFMFLLKILTFTVPFGFIISAVSIKVTITLFGVLFFILLVSNIISIHMSNPMNLLKGGQTGEKEPKSKWFLALTGFAALGAGYYMALTVKNPLSAIFLFFVAVVLVIAGTYALFTAGSILVLKLLKKNKRFYYEPRHFSSVSGMIYRMKQNAAGLASICILSTAVLIMVASTVSLYAGMDDILRVRFPRNFQMSAVNTSKEEFDTLKNIITEEAEKYGLEISNLTDYRCLPMIMRRNGTYFSTNSDDFSAAEFIKEDNTCSIYILPYEEFERLDGGTREPLKDNEAMLFPVEFKMKGDSIQISGTNYNLIKVESEQIENIKNTVSDIVETCILIVKDEAAIKHIYETAAAGNTNDSNDANNTNNADNANDANNTQTGEMKNLSMYLGFDYNKDADIEDFENSVNEKIKNINSSAYTENETQMKNDFFSIYGGLFFLGIFLGLLFMMATVLIIYYKQVSEGYDDKNRFEIMQKVGMSKDEVKKSIKSQVLMVFFLPVLMAVVHVAFAFKMITKLLALLQLTNVGLFAICTFVVILIFTLIYILVYSRTAKVYYKIVN